MTHPAPVPPIEERPESGFWVAVYNASAMERHRHWTPDEVRAHRFAQLWSEEYGIAYILRKDQRVTGPYLRVAAVYKQGVHFRPEPGQLWLRLPAVDVRQQMQEART